METILSLQNHTLYVYDFDVIDSRTYMLREGDDILLIDPTPSDFLSARMQGARHAFVYLTHEHYDHIQGVDWVRKQVECEVWCSTLCAERMMNPKENLARTFPLLFLQDREKYQYVRQHTDKDFTCRADHTFATELNRIWRGHTLYMRKSEGHSPGGSMLLLDESLLFAGDSLLGNGLEIKSLGADEAAFKEQVLCYVKTLQPELMVCPGHGDVCKLKEILQKIKTYIE